MRIGKARNGEQRPEKQLTKTLDTVSDIKDSARMSLLFDYYEKLLGDRQRTVFGLYHEDNCSLGEIADELGISRQGVHDALKKAEAALDKYEERLGLLAKRETYLRALRSVEATAAKIASDDAIASISVKEDEARIRRYLGKIKKTVGDLDV
ncbi:MAG: DNA-binding protein [Clostridiales Family XIII bacterium]|jgi:predicted DNA-binding protein YlxM (UPF0122 family)|nr:DNA-binding protein [Clostridiales Family XIII bacterium]